MYKKEIVYKPSFIAKIARKLIPILNKYLPDSLYKLVYDFLYNFYKKLLRLSYFFKYIFYKLFGNKKQQLKTKLTLKLFNYTMGGRMALENAFDLVDLVNSNDVKGSLVECGVAEGGTAAMMALANKHLGNVSRNKWFFDSYEGLPEPTEKDYEMGKTGNFIRPLPKGSCLGTLEQVQELMFDNLKFSINEINLIKGWFEDTVPNNKDKVGPIAILRLDGDWYESTKVPLENFYNQISDGGYIIVDDYLTCFGSRKAVDEFLDLKNIKIKLNLDGRGGVWFKKL